MEYKLLMDLSAQEVLTKQKNGCFKKMRRKKEIQSPALPAPNSGFVEKFAKLFIRFGAHVVRRN